MTRKEILRLAETFAIEAVQGCVVLTDDELDAFRSAGMADAAIVKGLASIFLKSATDYVNVLIEAVAS